MISFHIKKSAAYLLIIFAGQFVLNVGFAGIPQGSWHMSGEVIDVLIASTGYRFTNTSSLTGHYENGIFTIDLIPQQTVNNIAESVGWDGNDLFLIQRYPKSLGLPHGFQYNTGSRDKSLGYIEPSIFSRYATAALTSPLMAFASSNDLSGLESGDEVVILDTWRVYPEESNVYTVDYLASGGFQIKASSPGKSINPDGSMTPISGFENGFTRWSFKSNVNGFNGSTNDEGVLLTEYKRFDPGHQIREVTSKILFNLEPHVDASNVLPEITEEHLTVMDYSQRQKLTKFYKRGLFDQNRVYVLNNHLWNFNINSNIVAKDFNFRSTYFENHGLPDNALDLPPVGVNQPSQKRHKIIILAGLGLVSLIFSLMVWSRTTNR